MFEEALGRIQKTGKAYHLRLLSLAIFIFAWQVMSGAIRGLPTPVETTEAFFTLLLTNQEPILHRSLITHTTASLVRVLEGSLLGFAIAIPLGLFMGWSERLEVLAGTIVEALRPIPPLAWIPLAYVLFTTLENTSLMVQVFIVFMGAFFPALVNTIHGVQSVDEIYVEAARTFGANDLKILRKVIIPAALPAIITGIRIGLGVGWMCIVAAEMVGGSATGIGFFIWAMYEVGGNTANIIAGMIAIGIVGYLMNDGLIAIQRRVAGWQSE